MLQLNIITKYTIYGIAFGLAFSLTGWMLDIINFDLAFSPAAIIQIHQNNFLHYIIDMAPFVLGIVFCVLSKAEQQILGTQAKPRLSEIIRSA
ncbi:MAG: hypothetical protein IIA06_13160 [Proteobacteria bacterium]|nr:hypothetical protein [Pseudomonadota bacterium]